MTSIIKLEIKDKKDRDAMVLILANNGYFVRSRNNNPMVFYQVQFEVQDVEVEFVRKEL